MKTQRYYGWLDRFRLIAALLVIAIHTSPLASLSGDADFFFTRVLARVAVPFFFMVTGYFTLNCLFSSEQAVTLCPPHLPDSSSRSVLKRCLSKLCILYGISVLLYLPIGIYAGHYREISFTEVLRMLLFDGTFYHLWYFPACILGVLLVSLFSRFFGLRGATVISAFLYAVGLLGDSYFGLADKVPFLHTAYEGMFRVFSYTRNGLFLAPLFLMLGIWAARIAEPPSSFAAGTALALSFAAMTAEAFLLRRFELQRHDSMYFFLVPTVFFLYLLLLSLPGAPSRKSLRTAAMWTYVLHPAFIVVVRGAAKVLHLTALLVDNSLLHYLAVTLLSTGAGLILAWLSGKIAERRSEKNITDKSDAAQESFSAAFGAARRAWIELDSEALGYNVRFLQSLLPEECRLMPAVKANAYGHGAVLIATELNRLGIRSFCVACASEGIELRKAGIKGEILILGYTPSEQLPLLQQYRLSQTILDYPYAESLKQSGVRLHVHIAVDTGMHRLGIRCEDMKKIEAVYGFQNLTVDGIYTHLSASDSDSPESRAFTKCQIAAFYQVTETLKADGCPCRGVHLLSSYGILNYPEAAGDYVRPGIALYGLLSSDEDSCRILSKKSQNAAPSALRPVLSLKARVSSVRILHEGESAGYGLAFTAKRDMKLAVLSIGYADGLPRALSHGNGRALIHGYSAPILGLICMDQTLADVSEIPDSEIAQGDTAVLIGRSGTQEITAEELAQRCGTITNEILSRLGTRLERVVL